MAGIITGVTTVLMLVVALIFLWRNRRRLKRKLADWNLIRLPTYEEVLLNPIVDPRWIDIKSLRDRMAICEHTHGDPCSVPQANAGGPKWLVDIRHECLAAAAGDEVYAALSYVWGGVATTQSTADNITLLQEVGSLNPHSGRFQLPATIRDAIKLAGLLGLDYIWVDQLCIQQDSATKHHELGAMDSIYASAHVTIVAANGWDADHGLRGIEGATEPRQHFGHLEDSFQALSASKWYSRGWTFQELLFSRRILLFQYQSLLWICKTGVFEEGKEDGILTSMLTIMPRSIFENWPDLPHYAGLVREYSLRELSFPGDVINAFAGIISTMSTTFVDGFIHGLPAMYFDIALLWQPMIPLERRLLPEWSKVDSPYPRSVYMSHVMFRLLTRGHSWSWSGWVGEVDTSTWSQCCDYDVDIYKRCRVQCNSSVKWALLDSSHRDARNIRMSYRDMVRVVESNLQSVSGLEGWNFQGSHWTREGSVNPRLFRYPLPVAKIATESEDSSPLLRGSARMCKLRAGLRLREGSLREPSRHHCAVVTLLTNGGARVGKLRLNSFADASSAELPFGKEVELLEISTGVHTGSTEASFLAGIRPTDEMETVGTVTRFVNVLWVERRGEILYRRALGHVLKQAWDRIAGPPEVIFLG